MTDNTPGTENSSNEKLCQVRVSFFGLEYECDNAATKRFEVGCVHEHVRQLYTCDGCAPDSHAEDNYCRRCEEAAEGAAHDCRVTFAELPFAAAVGGHQ